jgi:hypothetical protein
MSIWMQTTGTLLFGVELPAQYVCGRTLKIAVARMGVLYPAAVPISSHDEEHRHGQLDSNASVSLGLGSMRWV